VFQPERHSRTIGRGDNAMLSTIIHRGLWPVVTDRWLSPPSEINFRRLPDHFQAIRFARQSLGSNGHDSALIRASIAFQARFGVNIGGRFIVVPARPDAQRRRSCEQALARP